MRLVQNPAVDTANSSQSGQTLADRALASLTQDGAVTLPSLVSHETLAEMRMVFESRLRHMSLNNVAGYQRGELYRLTVDNVLTLSQGFVDIGLHPLVTEIISRYVGPSYGLCEAKGWQTQRTSTDFNTWHGDSWYDQDAIKDHIPREIKLAFYLTDVTSGAFQYIKGTHRQRAPYVPNLEERQKLTSQDVTEFKGGAGTAILFDTSGIHRQGVPVLEPRSAVFYDYHDRSIPLQKEDVDYYRYHPLILNAAFLGDLTPEHCRVLGFGDKRRLQLRRERSPRFPTLHNAATAANALGLRINDFSTRASGKLKRLFGTNA